MIPLRRKKELREEAERAREEARAGSRVGRTAQVARSTVETVDGDVPVADALAGAVDSSGAVESLSEDVDLLDDGSGLWDADGLQDAEDHSHEAFMQTIVANEAVIEAQEAVDQVVADVLEVAQTAADAQSAAAGAASAAAAAQSSADAADAAAAQAAADAVAKSAAAEAAAKAHAEAQAAAAEAAAVAAASGDASAKAAAAEAAAVAAAAADASSKAAAAEAAAKADAAAAQSTADTARTEAAAAQSAASSAQAEADSVRFLAEGLFQVIPSTTAPTTSPTGALKAGDQWWVVGTGDLADKFIGVQVYNGTVWQPRQLVADSVLVPGSVGNVLIGDGQISGPKIAVDALDFREATGMKLTAGEIIGALIQTAASGQRLQLDVNGLRAFNAANAATAALRSGDGGLEITGDLVSSETNSSGDISRSMVGRGRLRLESRFSGSLNYLLLDGNGISYVGSVDSGPFSIANDGNRVTDHTSVRSGARGELRLSGGNGIFISPGSYLYPNASLQSDRSLKVLWEGATWPLDTQIANLSESVNSQLNGIVVEWSSYSGGSPNNTEWNYTHIPKSAILRGSTIRCALWHGNDHFNKLLDVRNTTVRGHSVNNSGSPRNLMVMRRIYGY